jgi:hypothetical protein
MHASTPEHTSRRIPLSFRLTLWIIAFILMAAAAIYQRTTGPTYPMRGDFTLNGQTYSYRLIRSDYSDKTNDAARVVIPDPTPADSSFTLDAKLSHKRYNTDDPFTFLPMTPETVDGENVLVGKLPAQPAAGKLEYFITLELGDETVSIPDEQADPDANTVVIRFKDTVPDAVLTTHVVFMFFSMLIGMRAALAALVAPSLMRRMAFCCLIGLTIGGMIFGPIVQKHAFGAYWTGFPFGKDLTDSKTLFMWLGWIIACVVIGVRPKKKEIVGRLAVLAAAILMTAVYLIPHSMQGSELDYSQVDQGVDPADAIGTSDQ